MDPCMADSDLRVTLWSAPTTYCLQTLFVRRPSFKVPGTVMHLKICPAFTVGPMAWPMHDVCAVEMFQRTAFLLLQVLHDWSDADSLAILKSIRAVVTDEVGAPKFGGVIREDICTKRQPYRHVKSRSV